MLTRISGRRALGRIIALTTLFITAATVGSIGRAKAQGAVFSTTNSSLANSVIMYGRDTTGALTPVGEFFTGGVGTGAGLTNGGAVAITPNHRELFAVNAGSNDVSAFAIRSGGLVFLGRIASGGTRPVSVTATNNCVYVLNAGTPNNISGFSIGSNGRLTPIAGSTQLLSSPNTRPAQIKFSPYNNVLVVTEQNTDLIDVFPLSPNGVAGPAVIVPSSGPHPYGFDFDPSGHLLISEAANNGASAYFVSTYGILDITRSLLDGQAGTCWLVANKAYAWTANAASDSITGYYIAPSGALSLIGSPNGLAVQLPTGYHPTDEAIDTKGHLYVLDANLGAITALQINADGTLTIINTTPAFGTGMTGVAAM